jgi:ATP-binding cassette, subfamily B, bacterial
MSAFSKPLANLSISRRVPVVMQMSAVECGAACLAMILSYYGRKTEVEECRELIGVGRDGISAKTIAHVARQFGLRVKAYSVELEAFEFVSLPAIAHWDFDHFVVIEKWSPDKIKIVDPATGRRTVSLAEFDRSFTGVVLTFEPGVLFDENRQNQSPNAKSRAIWRQYFLGLAQLPKITHVFFQVLLASLVLQLLGLALPIFTEVIVDDILRFQMQDTLKVMGLGLLLVVVAQFFINFLRASLLIYLQARLDSQLMLGFFEHLLTLP